MHAKIDDFGQIQVRYTADQRDPVLVFAATHPHYDELLRGINEMNNALSVVRFSEEMRGLPRDRVVQNAGGNWTWRNMWGVDEFRALGRKLQAAGKIK